MGWLRERWLDAAKIAGVALLATGGAAYAAPEWYDGLSEGFESASETGSRPPGGRYGGLAGAITYFEPNTALMLGTAALAYGYLVPKSA